MRPAFLGSQHCAPTSVVSAPRGHFSLTVRPAPTTQKGCAPGRSSAILPSSADWVPAMKTQGIWKVTIAQARGSPLHFGFVFGPYNLGFRVNFLNANEEYAYHFYGEDNTWIQGLGFGKFLTGFLVPKWVAPRYFPFN